MIWLAHGNCKWWLVKRQTKRHGNRLLGVRAVSEQATVRLATLKAEFLFWAWIEFWYCVCYVHDTLDYVICGNICHTLIHYSTVMWFQVWEHSMNKRNLSWNVMHFTLWNNTTERQFKCVSLPGPQSGGVNREPIFSQTKGMFTDTRALFNVEYC